MKKISIVILLASSFWVMAQERPQMNDIDADGVELTPVFVGMPAIATDRPDITESAQINPVGWFQYEGGYQFSHAEERISLTSISDAHQIEQVLRFGINRKFEMRAVINSNTQRIDIVDTWNDPFRTTGVNPVTIGFKYNLFKETDLLPQTTWLSHLTLPWVAAGDYRAPAQGNVVFHEQRLMLEKGLTQRLGIASNIGISGGMNGTNGFVDGGMFSLALGYDLGNDYGVYAEYFSNWQLQGQQLFGTPYFDGGFTKLLSNDLQLDIYAGFDLSPYVDTRLNTSGLFFGTGVSYRFPLAHYLR
jgi:hypothetical protein